MLYTRSITHIYTCAHRMCVCVPSVIVNFKKSAQCIMLLRIRCTNSLIIHQLHMYIVNVTVPRTFFRL